MTLLLPVLFSVLAASGPGERVPLKVLYVGNADTPRGAAFGTFLAEHFQTAEVTAREGFDPGSAEGFDVVLLDWSQSDEDIARMEDIRSPLGPRADWTTPTVLLDSAGLLIASEWQTTGSYG